MLYLYTYLNCWLLNITLRMSWQWKLRQSVVYNQIDLSWGVNTYNHIQLHVASCVLIQQDRCIARTPDLAFPFVQPEWTFREVIVLAQSRGFKVKQLCVKDLPICIHGTKSKLSCLKFAHDKFSAVWIILGFEISYLTRKTRWKLSLPQTNTCEALG